MTHQALVRRDHGPAWAIIVASSDAGLRRRIAETARRTAGVALVDRAKDRSELERILHERRSSIVLLALPFRGFVELDGLRTIRALSPTSRTIVMSEAPADAAAVQALKLGARGYCALTTDPAVLGKAIHLVQRGEIWVGRRVMLQLLEELMELQTATTSQPNTELLTYRERQISELIAIGVSNKEVADKLSITEKTVKAHLTHIFRKLGLSSRLQLAVHALRPSPLATTKVR